MFRYKLRTLLIVLALGPPMLAIAWTLSTVPWRWQVTDGVIAFAMVAALVLSCFLACLIVGFLLTGVISVINWFMARIQRP
jgi:hypothetical protein